MTKNLLTFFATFVAGALIALAVRAATFEPHPKPDMPTTGNAGAVATPNSAAPHADHAIPTDKKPVNTVCAICGMEVDPKVPTAEYKGRTIGFGCRMCPPKFKADPDKYGPSYLRNEVLEN